MDDLTNFLKNDDNLAFVRRLQMIWSNNKSRIELENIECTPTLSAAETTLEKYEAIGIWHPMQRDGKITFARKNVDDWMFWETTRNFIAKDKNDEKQIRICMIGESAAAGMFFTPFFTPSLALEDQLSKNSEKEYDVIDLTKNSINADDINATVKASLQLNPEVIIVYAGNNWFSSSYFQNDCSFSSRGIYLDTIEKKKPINIADKYKETLERNTKKILRDLKRGLSETNAKIIFVIPACDYLNWDHKVPTPWLGQPGATSEWHELCYCACAYIDDEKFAESLNAGMKMMLLDGGKQPVSNRIVASSLIKLGRLDEAYPYCMNVIDYCNATNEVTSLPGTPSFIKKIIKNECENGGINVIDMEEVFSNHLCTNILDNRIFIDYCHMTPEGFNVSMSPITTNILKHFDKEAEEISWQQVIESSSVPYEQNRFSFAVSKFYIGLYLIHINHRIYGPPDTKDAQKHIREAVNLSPEILDVMEDYVKAKSCDFGNGFLLSKAGQRILEKANSPLDIPVARFGQGVDPYTIDTICMILDENQRDGKKLLTAYFDQYTKQLDSGVDISEPSYIEGITSVIRLKVDAEINTRRHLPYFKARWKQSCFSLVSDAKNSIEVTLTCRLRNASTLDTEMTHIEVNGQKIISINLTRNWKKIKFIIDRGKLNYGFNRLVIIWPKLDEDEESPIHDIRKKYLIRSHVDLFPVFGEVFSIIAKNQTICDQEG